MATQAEIEAAEREYERVYDEMDGGSGRHKRALIAALEAAERVRPRETSTERTRRHRAKKRAAGNAPAAGNVPDAGGDVSPRAGPDPDLLARLTEAAGGNVAPGAVDVAPIQVLLAHGCDLDLDVLPVLREIATSPVPIKRWDHPPLIRAILRQRNARIPAPATPTTPARQPPQYLPGVPRFDMDELVAGYRAGNVDWDVTTLGPPPGSPGCQVDAGILRANGYR